MPLFSLFLQYSRLILDYFTRNPFKNFVSIQNCPQWTATTHSATNLVYLSAQSVPSFTLYFSAKIQLCDERCSKMSPFPEHFGKCVGRIKVRRRYCKKLQLCMYYIVAVAKKRGEETSNLLVMLRLGIAFPKSFLHSYQVYGQLASCRHQITHGIKK